MGWACVHCGDINSTQAAACTECSTPKDAETRPRIEPQPITGNLIWLATLLGGVLGGYLFALWNARILKPREFSWLLLVYGLIAVVGWIFSIFLISKLTAAYGIVFVLGMSFLLVAIPYNRDTLAASQWTWSHPIRKIVINIGGSQSGLRYRSFTTAEGQLFGSSEGGKPLLSIPVIPVIVAILSAVIGAVTLVLGNVLF